MAGHHGTVWWSELMTRDLEGARDYYAQVCGWEYEERRINGTPYLLATRLGRPVAGLMQMTPEMGDVPAHWVTYLAVSDLAHAIRDTRAEGGELIRAPFDVRGIGRIAMVKDPTGAVAGLMIPEESLMAQPSLTAFVAEVAESDDDFDLDNVPV